jgi:hypothetical protein
MNQPTPYIELNDVLRKLSYGVAAILGDNLIGVYLQGSFAIGDFDTYSDCDFVVAVEDELNGAQVAVLQELHRRLYDQFDHWGKHLEGSYFPRPVLWHMNQAGRPLWYLDHGSRTFERSDHCNTLVVRATLREHGVTLAGPPPAGLVEPIPTAALRDEIRTTMIHWGKEIMADPGRYCNRFYQGYLVLNYSRMLRDLRHGRVGSKRAGAEWAKANLDPRWIDLIDWALAFRSNPERSVYVPADPVEFAVTLAYVAHIIDLVQVDG